MTDISPINQKIVDDVKVYGWHIIKVLEDDSGPGFGYSIGLFQTFGHPEILMVGLNIDLIHNIINNIGEDIKNGKSFNNETFQVDIIDGVKCYFTLVDTKYYNEYVGKAEWFYNEKEFPLLQCIYPTVKGIYPWEKSWPENIRDLQPILGPIKL